MDKTREENEQECLEFCLSMSDNPEFQESIKNATHEKRVLFLLDNGFTFDGDEYENKELEKLYRMTEAIRVKGDK